jgi:hypothetical protein
MQNQVGPFKAVQPFIFPTAENKLIFCLVFRKLNSLIVLRDVFQQLLEQQLEEAVLEARHFQQQMDQRIVSHKTTIITDFSLKKI